METKTIDEEIAWGYKLAVENGFPPTYEGIKALREKLEKEQKEK